MDGEHVGEAFWRACRVPIVQVAAIIAAYNANAPHAIHFVMPLAPFCSAPLKTAGSRAAYASSASSSTMVRFPEEKEMAMSVRRLPESAYLPA